MPRNKTDLRDPRSFDHVGRDADNTELCGGRVAADLADHDERVVAGSADLTWATFMSPFYERHPDRYFNFGIAERNMFGAAAGLATCGLIPYVATFASFSGVLGYEAIRTDMAYPRLPVRIFATHAGISLGFFGTSHHATEDLAALRAIANLTVVSPADGTSAEALIRSTAQVDGPVYYRLGRGREGVIYDGGLPEGYVDGPYAIRQGAADDLLIVATGVMVRSAVEAAGALAEEGVDATVLDVHTIKPFPGAEIAEAAAGRRAVLVVEEHNVEGGLGTMVRDALIEAGVAVPVLKHGLYDEFAIVGPPTHLLRYYGLDGAGVATVARRLLELVDAGRFFGRAERDLWTADDRERVAEWASGRRKVASASATDVA